MTTSRATRVDLKRAALILCSAIVIVLVLAGVSGYVIFTRAPMDPLRRADVIVVLGGEHDGREDYGLSLARNGWAPTVVISNPYPSDDPVMRRVCNESSADVVVICQRPNPLTTRGEAQMTRRLAQERSWKTIIVLSWQYHLPRARFIFNECLGGHGGVIVMRAVPRGYHNSFLYWEFTYLYQFGGLMKAVVQGDCS